MSFQMEELHNMTKTRGADTCKQMQTNGVKIQRKTALKNIANKIEQCANEILRNRFPKMPGFFGGGAS